jgi:hypothetical protein
MCQARSKVPGGQKTNPSESPPLLNSIPETSGAMVELLSPGLKMRVEQLAERNHELEATRMGGG